jgi:hypothetical protein
MLNHNSTNKIVEFCCHCGRSVAKGSGWFANRVPDLNDIETRIAMNRSYPEGDFVCTECDAANDDDEYNEDFEA